ncbi:MAG: 3D domain-containing protein [Kiritimatiellales bacterium]
MDIPARWHCVKHKLRCLLPAALVLLGTGCSTIRPPQNIPPRKVAMEATAYCPCGKCCSWERSILKLGRPVYSSGPNKGKVKKTGLTASGTKAKYGTIAADTHYYPFGTIMYVPGYGYGRVEDTGGAIKGPSRIDLFYRTHDRALKWGRKKINVVVWRK